MLLIKDRLYGDVEIDEPVLEELIASKPLVRMKGIGQAGATTLVMPERNITRYEHTIGVMILLRKLGASVEEQIAGLLHDVPHTAFSHVIDFVVGDESHEYHEKCFERIIKESEIPDIIEKYGYEVDRILDHHNFPLLEQDKPELCADRIDYSLRDSLILKESSLADPGNYWGLGMNDHREKLVKIIDSLSVHNDIIVMNDSNLAYQYAKLFLLLDQNYWAYVFDLALYYILAKAIRTAWDRGIIVEDDFFLTDKVLYDKLASSEDDEVIELLELLRPDLRLEVNSSNYDFHIKTKSRFIDPKCIIDNQGLAKVSDIYPDLTKDFSEHIENVDKGYNIKILG